MKKLTALLLTLCMVMTMVTVLTVPASAASWIDEYTLTGKASKSGDAIVIDAPNGQEGLATRAFATSAGLFDVEWTMQVKAYSGSQNVQILTGKYRCLLVPKPDGLMYHAAGPANTNQGHISYDIGYDEHVYRVKGNGKDCQLFIDGYYIEDFQIEDNGSASLLKFWGYGTATSNSNIIIKDVIVHPIAATSASSEDKNIPPQIIHETFDDPKGDYSAWDLRGNWWYEDGCLNNWNKTEGVIERVVKMLGFQDEYTLKMRVKIPSFGLNGGNGFQLFLPNYKLYGVIYPDVIMFECATGNVGSLDIHVDTETFHEYRIEGYDKGKYADIYFDDQFIANVELAPNDRTDNHIYIYSNSNGAIQGAWSIDEFYFEPRLAKGEIVLPHENATYLHGREIEMKTLVHDKEADVPYMEYKINGMTVATGQAPDYLAKAKGLGVGSYRVTAEYNGQKYGVIPFSVVSAIDGEVALEEKDGAVCASLNLYDRMEKISEVEYLVDGIPVASATAEPYTVTLPAMTPDKHRITAVCYDENRMALKSMAKEWEVDLNLANQSVGFTNEISYVVSGESGSATYELKNGNHQVLLTHTPEKVTYLTDTGEQSFDYGTGKFTIITEGATTEVYRNGQLAFSYFLPRTAEVGQTYTENGMTFSEKSLSVPKERSTYFVKRNVTDKQGIYHLADLPYAHNVEFVADKTDEVRFVLNDGFYRTDVSLEDGKLYVWTSKFDSSEAFKKELATALDDKAYYRIETTAGMSRLYGNGRWLGSFRNIHTIGEDTFAVEVTAGDGLDYVAVVDNKDLYLYQDDFYGSGEFKPIDYWQNTNGMSAYANTTMGFMMLEAKDKKNAISELNAFSGDVDFSVDVNIKEAGKNGGFWLLINHSVTNAYTKVGYNYETGKYEIVDRFNDTYNTIAEAEGKLPLRETVRMDLTIRHLPSGKQVVLAVNGEPVISAGHTADQRGKVGFIMDDSVAYVESVSYRGDAKPLLALTDTVLIGTTISPTMDMIERSEDEIVMVSENQQWMSTTDGGKNWKLEGKLGGSFNMIRLVEYDRESDTYNRTEEIVAVGRYNAGHNEDGISTYNYKTFYSANNGENWTELDSVMPTAIPNRITMNNRITQGPSGRLYFPSCENNNEDFGYTAIFYSDDKGKTWTKSEVDLDAKELGYCIQEVVCLETEEGVVRAFFRNNMGFVHYMNSYDYGKTWDTEHIYQTPFLSTLNCYNIEIDPYDMKTLYIAWGYDNANLHSTNQFPRSRWGFARSHDGGLTWEFLGTAHENNNTPNDFTMMNLSINVAKDYVVLNCFSDDSGLGKSDLTSRTVVLEKAKLKGVMDFEQLHMKNLNSQIEITRVVKEADANETLLVHPESNRLMLHGSLVNNAVSGDYILLDSAAAFLGAKAAVNADGSASMTCGESSVTIGKESISQINGKAFVNLEAFADQFGLHLQDNKGVKIITNADWSGVQKQTACCAIDLFADEM